MRASSTFETEVCGKDAGGACCAEAAVENKTSVDKTAIFFMALLLMNSEMEFANPEIVTNVMAAG
jgi:hypothetical protein